MATATLTRPVSLPEAYHVVLVGAAGAATGVTARWLDTIGPAPHSVGGVVELLLALIGTWIVLAAVIARTSPTMTQAVSRTAVFMGALALGRFYFGSRFHGQTDYDRLTPWLVLGLVALPALAGFLWWTAHRAWRTNAAVQLFAGVLLSVPVAVLGREVWWAYVLRGDDLVAGGVLLLLAGALVFAATRTMGVFLGLLLAVMPAYRMMDELWPAYTQALTSLLSPGAPFA